MGKERAWPLGFWYLWDNFEMPTFFDEWSRRLLSLSKTINKTLLENSVPPCSLVTWPTSKQPFH